MAARLRRSPSTVSREIERNGCRDRYRAAEADQKAWDRTQKPQPRADGSVPEKDNYRLLFSLGFEF